MLGGEDPLEEEMATVSSIFFFLGNPMDGGAWQATIHGVARVRHDLGTKEKKRERNRADNIGYIIWQNPIGN